MRQDARSQPHKANGTFALKYTPEQRLAIIHGVPDAILSGKTTTQYAKEQGIPSATLRAWIIGDESVEQARGLLLAHELAVRSEIIDNAEDPLTLARGREGFRAWSWIAERRESRLYGQKQEVTVEYNIRIDPALIGRATELLDQMRDVTPTTNSGQLIDATQQEPDKQP
jgi:hypothetical protein